MNGESFKNVFVHEVGNTTNATVNKKLSVTKKTKGRNSSITSLSLPREGTGSTSCDSPDIFLPQLHRMAAIALYKPIFKMF
jgi:hypothetical protein